MPQTFDVSKKNSSLADDSLSRSLSGKNKFIVLFLSLAWAFFQLGSAFFFVVDSIAMRSIHLAFALLIAFVVLPFSKKSFSKKSIHRKTDKVNWWDWLLGVGSAILALYIVFEYSSLVTRYGDPNFVDKLTGFLLLVLLLEATRRSIGPALPVIAILFCLYCFVRPWLPPIFSAKAVSISRFFGQLTLSTEGIYGIPLDVSATVVYLFVLFGALMYQAGGGEFFIRLSLFFLGRFRGGPAKAAILGSGLTGMLSGSSIANIVTTGTFTIPLMKKVGYPAEKAASIEVASSTDGQIAPPIMGAAAFIIAEYVNIPYLGVIKAAIIPALASYLAIFFISHFEACKLGLRGLSKEELPSLTKTLRQGFLFFIPLSVLIYQLIIARQSPEKSAFFAILSTLPIIFFLAWQQTKNLKASLLKFIIIFIDSAHSAAKNMLSVALATASAGIIVAVISLGLGGSIVSMVDFLSMGNIFLLLLITALVSLFIGMGLPTTATYIVMATIIAPVITDVGQSYGFVIPLIAAHLFCFYFGILADDTPPVGLAAYAASSIAQSHPIRTSLQAFSYDIRTAILPFVFVFNTEVILYGVDSWFQGFLIALNTCIASIAFVSLIQGWFLTKTTIIEGALLLAVVFCGYFPGQFLSLLGLNVDKTWQYFVVFLPMLFLILSQVLRRKQNSGEIEET